MCALAVFMGSQHETMGSQPEMKDLDSAFMLTFTMRTVPRTQTQAVLKGISVMLSDRDTHFSTIDSLDKIIPFCVGLPGAL